MDKFPQGVDTAFTRSIDQDLSPQIAPRGMEIVQDPKRTSRRNHEQEKKIEIDQKHRAARDPKTREKPEKKRRGRTSENDGFHHPHQITDIRVSPGSFVKT